MCSAALQIFQVENYADRPNLSLITLGACSSPSPPSFLVAWLGGRREITFSHVSRLEKKEGVCEGARRMAGGSVKAHSLLRSLNVNQTPFGLGNGLDASPWLMLEAQSV